MGIIPIGPTICSLDFAALAKPLTASPNEPSPPARMIGAHPSRAACSTRSTICPFDWETANSKSTPAAFNAASASGQRFCEFQRLEYGFKITLAVICPRQGDLGQLYPEGSIP